MTILAILAGLLAAQDTAAHAVSGEMAVDRITVKVARRDHQYRVQVRAGCNLPEGTLLRLTLLPSIEGIEANGVGLVSQTTQVGEISCRARVQKDGTFKGVFQVVQLHPHEFRVAMSHLPQAPSFVRRIHLYCPSSAESDLERNAKRFERRLKEIRELLAELRKYNDPPAPVPPKLLRRALQLEENVRIYAETGTRYTAAGGLLSVLMTKVVNSGPFVEVLGSGSTEGEPEESPYKAPPELEEPRVGFPLQEWERDLARAERTAAREALLSILEPMIECLDAVDKSPTKQETAVVKSLEGLFRTLKKGELSDACGSYEPTEDAAETAFEAFELMQSGGEGFPERLAEVRKRLEGLVERIRGREDTHHGTD